MIAQKRPCISLMWYRKEKLENEGHAWGLWCGRDLSSTPYFTSRGLKKPGTVKYSGTIRIVSVHYRKLLMGEMQQ